MVKFVKDPNNSEIFAALRRLERTVIFVPTATVGSETSWECRKVQWGTIFGDNAYTVVCISMPTGSSQDEIFAAYDVADLATHMALCKAA